MKSRVWQTISSLIFFAIAAIGVPLSVSAFGISPPFIRSDRLVPGARFDTTIYLVQGQPKEDLDIKATLDVPEKISKWFVIDKGNEFTIPAGIQQFPIVVTVQVPQDADFGIYQGYLRINTIPTREAGEQVTISVGARVDINLTVGEGVVADFQIKKVEILDIEEGSPPAIEFVLENTGNVPIAPERATFDLYDKFGDIRLAFSQTEDIPEVPAFETKTITLKFPIDIKLGIGEYWADAKLYRNGQSVRELKTVFNVVARSFGFFEITTIAAGLVVVGGIAIFIKKKYSRG